MPRGLYKSKKGSLTVEAAFVFPMVIAMIVMLGYLCIFIYNRTIITAFVDDTIIKGAEYLNKGNISFDTGEITKSSDALYTSDKAGKKEKFEEYLQNKIKKYCIMSDKKNGTKTSIKIEPKNYVLFYKLNVDVDIEYNIPLKGFFKLIGLNNTYESHISQSVTMDNPVAFVRNTDLIGDLFKELASRNALAEKMGNGYNEFLNFLDGVPEKIDKLMGN